MNGMLQQQVIYQQVVKAPSNGMAITALILGIVAIAIGIWSPIPFIGIVSAFVAFLPAVLAIIFGHMGFKNSREMNVDRGQAMTGMILGYVTVGIISLTTFVWIGALTIGSASGY